MPARKAKARGGDKGILGRLFSGIKKVASGIKSFFQPTPKPPKPTPVVKAPVVHVPKPATTVEPKLKGKLSGSGRIRHETGKTVILPKTRPYQYQGVAEIRFKASGDQITWYSGVITSSTPLSKDQLREQIIKEIKRHFSNSPVLVLNVDYVYARKA